MNEPETTSCEIEDDELRVELTWIGEGVCGEYDPENPHELPLTRFYVQKKTDEGWVDVDDGSYCTQLPADDQLGMQRLGHLILDQAGDQIRRGGSYKRILERLSWFNGRDDYDE